MSVTAEIEGDLVYNGLVVDHFRRPRNLWREPSPLPGFVAGAAGRRRHGTRMEFQVLARGPRVLSLQFRAYGCPHAIALGSWLTEALPGTEMSETLRLDHDHISETLGMPARKRGIIVVAEDALRACSTQLTHV